jgi:hypothetical protein
MIVENAEVGSMNSFRSSDAGVVFEGIGDRMVLRTVYDNAWPGAVSSVTAPRDIHLIVEHTPTHASARPSAKTVTASNGAKSSKSTKSPKSKTAKSKASTAKTSKSSTKSSNKTGGSDSSKTPQTVTRDVPASRR